MTYHSYSDFISLVLVPSRELAIQIEEVAKKVSQAMKSVRTALLIGGESREQQVERIRMEWYDEDRNIDYDRIRIC